MTEPDADVGHAVADLVTRTAELFDKHTYLLASLKVNPDSVGEAMFNSRRDIAKLLVELADIAASSSAVAAEIAEIEAEHEE